MSGLNDYIIIIQGGYIMKSKVFCIGELLIDFICKDDADLINGINYEKKQEEHLQM